MADRPSTQSGRDGPAAVEIGPLAPAPDAKPIVQIGDVFAMGEHRIICGDATDPAVLDILMSDTDPARLVLTDEPYNVPVADYATRKDRDEFELGSAMTTAEVNTDWIGASLSHLRDAGLPGPSLARC